MSPLSSSLGHHQGHCHTPSCMNQRNRLNRAVGREWQEYRPWSDKNTSSNCPQAACFRASSINLLSLNFTNLKTGAIFMPSSLDHDEKMRQCSARTPVQCPRLDKNAHNRRSRLSLQPGNTGIQDWNIGILEIFQHLETRSCLR